MNKNANCTKVSLAAHHYAADFAGLRALVREICAEGRAVVAAQKMLKHVCSAGQVESTMVTVQLGQASGSFQPVPTEKVSRLRRTLAAEVEGVAVLDEAQVWLASVGEKFVKHVEKMREHLGNAFTLRLVRHCSHLAFVNPDSSSHRDAWNLFCVWWRMRDAPYANLVFGGQPPSPWCEKLLLSSLYGKMVNVAAAYSMVVNQALAVSKDDAP